MGHFKTQANVFIKIVFLVFAISAFFLFTFFYNSFQEATFREKSLSEFKMKSMNVLQLLLTEECLGISDVYKKAVLDKNKLDNFSLKYNETEPECAKAEDFDYNVRIIQLPKEIETYKEVIKEKKCKEECFHVGYGCKIRCYTVCDEIEKPSKSYKIYIEEKSWTFGLPMQAFSPDRSRINELQISLPVSIKYNDTLIVEGIIYFYAVEGDFEKFYSFAEHLCQMALSNPNRDFTFSVRLSFPFSLKVVGDRICMLNSCKRFICPIPTSFRDFEKGEYIVNFVYNSSKSSISIY